MTLGTSACATLVLFFALAPAAFTVESAGVVSSEGPVSLDGTAFRAPGVIAWTVLNGDEVATATEPALVMLRNGARIILDAGSSIKVESSRITVREGRVSLSCPLECRISVAVLSQSVSLNRGDRKVVVIRNGKASWTSGSNAPAFSLPAALLLERLPYSMGVHLPSSQ